MNASEFDWPDAIKALAEAQPERVRLEADCVVVALRQPILIEGESRSEIALREPTLADIEKLDRASGDVAKTRVLIGICAGIPDIDVKRLRARDLTLVGQVVQGFF